MALPFLWEPSDLFNNGDKYIDGGVFNNYPIKAFDGECAKCHFLRPDMKSFALITLNYFSYYIGWFLSTNPEDSLENKAFQASPHLQVQDVQMD